MKKLYALKINATLETCELFELCTQIEYLDSGSKNLIHLLYWE